MLASPVILDPLGTSGVTDALWLARGGLEHAQRTMQRGLEAWAFQLIAEASLQGDVPDVVAAADHYHRALTLAQQLGMRPLAAHCHLGLGRLYRQTGNRTKADTHPTTAATMYAEMGMTFWLEKAEAAMGPPHRNSP